MISTSNSEVIIMSTAKENCVKCKTRPATGKDGLCDSCRYNETLDRIIESRAKDEKP
jgi:hypothetical protein